MEGLLVGRVQVDTYQINKTMLHLAGIHVAENK